MVRDAEKFAADDTKKKEEVELINQADNLAYATEKSLKEFGDKVSQGERADIEVKLNDLKSAIKDKNLERIKKGMEELTRASHKLAEEIYKQAAAKQQGQQQGPGPSAKSEEAPGEQDKKEDIIDAEYKEESDKK
jgi:molecular chaperone DnaK